jgi:hypothetical protein
LSRATVEKVFFMPYDPKNPNILSAQYEYGNVSKDMNKNQKEIDWEIEKGNRALAVYRPFEWCGRPIKFPPDPSTISSLDRYGQTRAMHRTR